MTARFKTTLKYLLSGLLTLAFLYMAFRGADLGRLVETLKSANYWWALSILPVLLTSHALRAWRWKYLLYPVKPSTRYRNLFSALIIGYMMNNILPRAGELFRPYAIGKLEGISRSAAFGTVLMERILDIVSFMTLIAFIPLVYSGPLTDAFPWLEETGIWLSVVTLAVLGLFVFLMIRRDIVMKLLSFATKRISEKRAALVEHITHSFLDGFLFLKEPGNYFMIIALSVVLWGLYIVMMYFAFNAFDMIQDFGLDFRSALVVQAISSIGYIMPTPGATGPYHYFTIQTLTKLYNVNEQVAQSYAVVTHAVGFIGVSVLGIFFFLKDQLHVAEVLKQDRPPVLKDGV